MNQALGANPRLFFAAASDSQRGNQWLKRLGHLPTEQRGAGLRAIVRGARRFS